MPSLVLTIVAPDRPGIVEALAATIAAHGGNWLESQMARLAGQFAGVLLIDAPADRRDALAKALQALPDLHVTVTPSTHAGPEEERSDDEGPGPAGVLNFTLLGLDRPGIVRDAARVLAQRGVNVTRLETSVTSAPMTGDPLFRATVEAALPPSGADIASLRAALEQVADTLSLDLTFD